MTGSMASSERPVVDATRLAFDEINERGGLLGRRIEVVVADGASDPETFAREAERLIVDEGVVTVFGCWTSASRRTVRPVFEAHDHLLFYPVQYEGVEQSPNIIYLGATPNQQLLPALQWAIRNRLARVFLVGSDYVFPHIANEILKDQARQWRGEIVGEEYLLLGSIDVDDIVRKISDAKPDVILNTINGLDSNVAFFTALRKAGIESARTPTISFSMSEIELSFGAEAMADDYVAWNYFQSIDSVGNDVFVERFKRAYGEDRVIGDPMAAAYVGVKLWAAAVEEAGTVEPASIRAHVLGKSYGGPGGMTHVDAETQHTWKPVRLGRIRPDGQIEETWTSHIPIRPQPYPDLRTRADWDSLLDRLQIEWGGRWENPGPQNR
jgi:urea transport system substrate-binding protein